MAEIAFPKAIKRVIEMTDQMRKVIKKTLRVHVGCALVVWSGRSRLGKTTTAKEMQLQLAKIYDPNDPDAFQTVHYQVGEIPPWSGNEQKKGIRSLYHKCVGRMDEGQYRSLPAEDLAAMLVHGLRRKNIRMIFIDEAGMLSLDAIRGMVLVRDVAENEGWTLSLVFIGMDDLPVKMTAVEQIDKRIHLWCFFQEYSIEELFAILKKVHPHFEKMSLENPDHLEQVSFLHERFGGVPGEVLPFLRTLFTRTSAVTQVINLQLLKTAYIHSQRDKTSALNSVDGYMAKSVEHTAAEKKRRLGRSTSKRKTTPGRPKGEHREKQTA